MWDLLFNSGFLVSNTVTWILNILFSIYVVYNGRKNPRSTIIWIFVVNLLSFVGMALFFMFGRDTRKSKMFSLKQENDDIIQQLSTSQYDKISEDKFRYKVSEIEKYNQLVKLNLISDDAYFTEDNDIKLYYWGEEKFLALIEDIQNAKRTIDIQYYIFRTDKIGRLILNELKKKIKEGVQVRFLYDALGSRTARKKYFKQLEQMGAQVVSFFPSVLGIINFRINYRNHRKLVIIDDTVGYIGGFNVGDDYLGESKMGPWRDTHIRVEGGAILGLKLRFLKDWYYASGEEPNLERDLEPVFSGQGQSATQVISSGPDTMNANIKNAIIYMINSANEKIYIQSPYLVPDHAVYEALKIALLRGVEVNIMIPKKPDHAVVHWCSMSFARDLAGHGANIYAYHNGFLHAKVIFIDDMVSTVGTTNLDERSFMLNFETNMVIYDKDINAQLTKQYMIDINDSELLTVEKFKNRPIYMKLREPIARIFSPLF
ncbi:MAG: cardiolipin synthase [Tissierellia bacterium]|nr:cardiolipin synthase [Tissierellia bacterium]